MLPTIESIDTEATACVPVVAAPKCDKVIHLHLQHLQHLHMQHLQHLHLQHLPVTVCINQFNRRRKN